MAVTFFAAPAGVVHKVGGLDKLPKGYRIVVIRKTSRRLFSLRTFSLSDSQGTVPGSDALHVHVRGDALMKAGETGAATHEVRPAFRAFAPNARVIVPTRRERLEIRMSPEDQTARAALGALQNL